MHVVLQQVVDVGVTLEKPQQLIRDGLEVDALRRDQGEPLRQIEANLATEGAGSASAGTVILVRAVVEDIPQEVLVGSRHKARLDFCGLGVRRLNCHLSPNSHTSMCLSHAARNHYIWCSDIFLVKCCFGVFTGVYFRQERDKHQHALSNKKHVSGRVKGMTAIFNAEQVTHNGEAAALGPNDVRVREAYKHEVDFSLDLDLLSVEEQQTVLELRAKVEQRRLEKQQGAEQLMTLRGEDTLTALASAANDIDKQRAIVRNFVKSTARSMSPENTEQLDGIIEKTFKRIRGLGFRGALAASRRVLVIKDEQIADRDSKIASLQGENQKLVDERDGIVADGTLYALTVGNALDNLNGAHMGDVYEMELIQEAREAVDAALPKEFTVATEDRHSITGELDAILTSETKSPSEDVLVNYPQAVGGQALINALSLARPTSEY